VFGDNLRGLQHIGIPVRDIARSRAFYQSLGFTEVMARELPQANDAIRVSMQERHGLVIELYQLVGADLAEVQGRGHGHIDHLALDVADIQAAWDTVREAGYQPLESAPVFLPFWDKGCYYFNILGPNGERVEFNQLVR